jgi:hypothetical protein
LNNEDNRTPVSQASRPWISSVAIAKVIENFAAKQVLFAGGRVIVHSQPISVNI